MIDFGTTLDPGHGLAEVFEVIAPTPPADPLWRTLVRLAARPGQERGTLPGGADPGTASGPFATSGVLTPFVVGAYGHSHADSLTRGVGEAVERFALVPQRPAFPGTAHGTLHELAQQYEVLAFHSPAVALGHPDAAERPLSWYPSRRLRDDRVVMVPSALVDYPALVDHPADGCLSHFDPGPSGAASGAGEDAALRSALFEIVERDAFLVAWDCGLPATDIDLAAIDPGAARDARERRAATALGTLLRTAARLGLEARVVGVPNGVAGVIVAAAVVVDRTGARPVATVGCKASDSVPAAALGSVQEALQLRSLVHNFTDDGAWSADAPIAGENDRLRYLSSPHGHDSITAWASRAAAVRPPPQLAPVSTAELLAAVVADGADPLVVDLSFRLPDPVHGMGWRAVKVIPVGYQHLRIDDRHTFSRNGPRRETVVARAAHAGLAASFPDGRDAPPHPLP